ncbi:hypothetical protein [Haloferax sp. DFSO60]|uniref:hypothetical protein n=1 Tax=Haloferax sp. DFSO60 TaxID=3388652 RepID=UPI00397CB148
MGSERDSLLLILGISVTVLISLIAISEFSNLGYTSAIEATGSLLFSGLLVWLYHRQSQILSNQKGLMEHQNQMMMEGHRPQLIFDVLDFSPDNDIVSIHVKNVGPGIAYDIGLELELDPRIDGYDRLVSYGKVVSVGGEEPTSLGVLRAGAEKEMEFKIQLPNPNQDLEQKSLPVSEALSEFDYSEFKKARICIKQVYTDSRGKSWGGSVIEQVPFYADEPVSDIEELWSYGLKNLEVEEAWID